MGIRADQQYNGHIENANLYYSNGGTLGLQLHLACDDGKISHTLWLTDKTIPRVEETLLRIGVSKDELHNEHALENIGEILGGREISFNTVAEDYKGQPVVKVQWLNKPRKDNGMTPAKMAASLFSGKQAAAVETVKSNGNGKGSAAEWGITDDDF